MRRLALRLSPFRSSSLAFSLTGVLTASPQPHGVESLTPLPHFTHTPLSLTRRQPSLLSPLGAPSLPSAGPSRCPAVPSRLCSRTTRTALSLPGGPLRARQPPSVLLPPTLAVAVSFPISRSPFALSLSLVLSFYLHLCPSLLSSRRPRRLPLDPRPSPPRFDAVAAAAVAAAAAVR